MFRSDGHTDVRRCRSSASQKEYLGSLWNGVLVGMIDTGIDYEHPAFRYEDGSSKIYSLWDQTIEGDPEDTFLGYGTEYTKEQIEEALKATCHSRKYHRRMNPDMVLFSRFNCWK